MPVLEQCVRIVTLQTYLPEVGVVPHSKQAKMLEAAGGYEYGRIDNSSIHTYISDKCVGCHMNTLNKASFDNITNHDFSVHISED